MQLIKTSKIKKNTGQIDGLPSNPRKFDKEEVERLARSIEETPELLDARPCIVIRHDGAYVIIGGNMRFEAVKSLGRKECPCEVLDDDTHIEKLKEILIKDNGQFGQWDTDALANEWGDLPLEDWGIKNIAGIESSGTDYEPSNSEIDVDGFKDSMTMRLRFQPDKASIVKAHFEGIDARKELLKLCGYGE